MGLKLGCGIWGAAALLLAACGAAPVKEAQPQQVPEAAVAEPALSPKGASIRSLLAEAEAALQQGRLTLPLHDNAYDRFRAVQMLDPGNAAANGGLQAILLVYVDRVQQALATQRLQAAATELRRAREYFPEAEQLDALAKALSQRSRALEAAAAPPPSVPGERISLPAQSLSDKSEEIQNLLIEVAQRVRESDETVLILARTDAEGRWIYKVMRESVGEYRIRGDIRITREPALVLQPPIEEVIE
jgi:hypothetical protein